MVTIGTWNLENLFRPGGDGPETEAEYTAKLTSLASTIAAIAPDVLAVQEVGDPAALTDLADRLDGEWHAVTSAHADGRGIRVGFLSREPATVVADSTAFAPGLAPVQVADAPRPPATAMGRGALTVRVEVAPGVPITLIACHLKSKLLSYPGGRFDARDEGERARACAYALFRRAAEAVTIRGLATAVMEAGTAERVVVLGDLNDEPRAATTQVLSGPGGSEIGTAGFATPDKGDRRRLWNLAPLLGEGAASRVYRGKGELIDHVLVSHALVRPLPLARVAIQSTLPSVTDDPAARRGKPGSDHSPVVAEFDL
jgi:endonuclease/exonuclease/phosphatase family metal-dependent hydrolase